jgi:hypothetical protein
MNNENKQIENKENNSLMRKTKSELVNIILRKDSIEKSLRTELKDANATISSYYNKLDEEKIKYDKLLNDYEYNCDEKIIIITNYKIKFSKYNKIIKILIAILLVSIGLNMLQFLI